MLKVSRFFAVIALFALLPCAMAVDEVVEKSNSSSVFYAITSASSFSQKSLTKRKLRRIFTLKQSIWPDGSAVQLVTLDTSDPRHIEFVENELKLFNYQVKRNWDRLVFSGSAQAPREVGDFEALIATVSATPGSIGYITQAQLKALDNEKITAIAIE